MPNLLSGRTKVTQSDKLSATRYQFVSLSQAQPALGRPTVDNSVLIARLDGTTSWVPQSSLFVSATVKNVLYVTKNGNDSNDGTSIAKAKATIANALKTATAGTTILVSSGIYVEPNPLSFPVDVSIIGQESKVIVVPKTKTSDVFKLNSGSNIQGITVSNHASPAFAFSLKANVNLTNPPSIRNCSSITGPFLADGTLFVPNQTVQEPGVPASYLPLTDDVVTDPTKHISLTGAGGGIHIDASVLSIDSILKSVIVENFTAINQGGVGIESSNLAIVDVYSSSISFANQPYLSTTGGQLNLHSCSSEYGSYGLVSDGFYNTSYTATGAVDQSLYSYISNILIVDGSSGYLLPPMVIIDPPTDPLGIQAEAEAIIDTAGTIVGINITEPGSGYSVIPSVTFDSGTATAEAELSGVSQITVTGIDHKPLVGTIVGFGGNPNKYYVTSATDLINGTTLITVNPLLYSIEAATEVNFYHESLIIANGHAFNYVGSGITFNAINFNGGDPVPTQQINETNYGRVFYSSLNESGDYKIGNLFEINQITGEITINAGSLDLTNISSIGPFLRNGVPAGVKLKEVSDNINLLASTGHPDNFTVPTQHAIATYLQNNYLALTGGTVTGPTSIQDLSFENNVISTISSNSNIVLSPNGTGVIDVSGTRIKNALDPILNQDVATKKYVDQVAGGGGASQNTNFQNPVIRIHYPSDGWLTTDDGKDVGITYNYTKPGNYVVVTSGSSDGTTATLNFDGPKFNIGSIITIAGVQSNESPGFNGIFKVTASTEGSVSYDNTTVGTVRTTGQLGTIEQIISVATTGGNSVGTLATISYNGLYQLADGDTVTITGITPDGYNGTYNIINSVPGSFGYVTTDSDMADISIEGTVYIANRFAFSGWSNNTGNFEFFKEGAETDNNVFSGMTGNVVVGALTVIPPSSITNTDITDGALLRIKTHTIYDTSTAASGTRSQGSIVNISRQTLGSTNTGVTYTNAASLYIANAPAAGSNVSITNAYALQIVAGDALLGGNLIVNGGNIKSTNSTFNLLNENVTTGNVLGNATTINIGGTNANLVIGSTSGNSTLTINGSSTSGSASIMTSTGVTTANVFNTIATTGNLFGSSNVINIANSGTSARAINIATNATDNPSTLTFGGAVTNNTIKIKSITSGNVFLLTDVTSGSANIFTSVTGQLNIGGGGSTVNIGATTGNSILELRGSSSSGNVTIRTTSGVTTANVFNTNATTGNIFGAATVVNVATNSVSNSTLTFGGTVDNNSLKIAGIASGTINLRTDVTTGNVNVFPSITGKIILGGNAIYNGDGVVMLGISPNSAAAGKEVVTAEWVRHVFESTTLSQVELTTLNPNQLISTGFDWSVYRSAKYLIQISQVGTSGTRAQTSEILVTSDSPYYTLTGVTLTISQSTINTLKTTGLYVGMTVNVTSGVGNFATNTYIVSINPGVSFTLSAAPLVALSDSTINAVLSGNYVSAVGATSSGTTISVSNTSKLYPGMGVTVTSGVGLFQPNTYVVSILNATTFTVNNIPSVALNLGDANVITGVPNVYLTEYAVIETNGTISLLNADTSTTNVTVTATPQDNDTCRTINIGTIVKTTYTIKGEFIEIG